MIVVIIGSGIVGLHIANQLKEKYNEVYILEKDCYLAEQTSGRNSGVIHAGIFYQPGSFKEKVCIEGNRLTYEWLTKLNVPHKNCGKWIVPELGQETQIESFFEKIRTLPIPPPLLKLAGEVQKEEPYLKNTRAILVPSTGIVDAADYVNQLAIYLETKGVTIIKNCQVTEVNSNKLKTTRGDIDFDFAINSAGLFSDDIAKMSCLENYTIKPCRGDYYLVSQCPIKRPVYHLPYKDAHGLGVHLTPTLNNQLLLGPNAFFIDKKEDYQHSSDPTSFKKALQYYLPHWNAPEIQVAYSGNRPKLYFKGESLTEFTMIKKENWIHLLGIESPGLTAAPALAKEIMKII